MPVEPEVFSSCSTALKLLDGVLARFRPYHWYMFDAALACVVVGTLLQWCHTSSPRLRTTQLRGPPSESFLFGVMERLLSADDSGAIYEAWAKEYGPVYAIPSTMRSRRIVLCDPKGIAHFFSKESWTYIQTPFHRKSKATFVGKGLLWADGEDHKRQRKYLTPAFSNAAIRQLTPIFYDSAYKAKGAWDALIESSDGDGALIEVQNWMNNISLDTIGIAGFSHDFCALEGKHVSVAEVFDTIGASPQSSTANKGLLLAQVFPLLTAIPSPGAKLFQKLKNAMEEISNVLLARTRKELEMGVVDGKEEKSIIGLLIKGANDNSEFNLTQEEVVAQMNTLLMAGYETTSISITWALLELSRNPDVQTKLRTEFLTHGSDPTYDELTNGLPYLDAVVHEIFRLHPPFTEFTRVAAEDDIIPLSEPIHTASGSLVDSLTIAKGTVIVISMESINRSTAIWGDDAKVFRPSRWLEDALGRDGIPSKAKEIQGHRHLLTFVDGPRTCLGKSFAVIEFKAVLAVLVKNFVFEMRDGPHSKIEIGKGMLPRPKLAGEVGCKLPLRVRSYAV